MSWSGKKGDIVYAKVVGSGSFPIDMLRYDCCSPASEQDSHLIKGSIRSPRGNWVIMVKKVLMDRYKNDHDVFTIGRWNSFGCAIQNTDNWRLDRNPPDVCIDKDNASLFSVFQPQSWLNQQYAELSQKNQRLIAACYEVLDWAHAQDEDCAPAWVDRLSMVMDDSCNKEKSKI